MLRGDYDRKMITIWQCDDHIKPGWYGHIVRMIYFKEACICFVITARKRRMCSFWWAEYSSGFNHSSISRKRRKRNVPYLSLGEREEETLLSYVTCRKLKLSQILCIIDGGHKVWGEGSVRWKKWVINWALGLNENSFNGWPKKAPRAERNGYKAGESRWK